MPHFIDINVFFLVTDVGDAVFDDDTRIHTAFGHRVIPDGVAGGDFDGAD